MAFVTLGASVLHGRAVPRPAASRATSRPVMAMMPRASPRTSFSSIDMPERATVLVDGDVMAKEDLLVAAYKHVFGNAYVMESERAALGKAESDFKGNTMSVRELVRAMAKSEAYRSRFFSRSGAYRFVELNCKHLLGRGPVSQEEVSFHVRKVMNEGYEAEIDSYIDSDEYETRFGEWTVPRFIFEGVYTRNDNFNRLAIMRKHWDGCSTSTVSGSTAPGAPIPAQLTMGWGGYVNGAIGVMKGLPAGFRPEATPTRAPTVPLNANAGVRTRVKIAENLYQVFEVPPIVAKDAQPERKLQIAGKKLNGAFY